MLANLASSLIKHKRIKTTTAKAKALRTFVEPLITRSKEDSTHSRRMVFKHLGDKYAVSELFRDVAAKVGDRPGGYTRIIKIDSRLGDNADMCIIELVDYNENLLAEKGSAKAKTSRRRRGKKKPGTEELKPAVTAAGKETVEEPSGELEETVTDSNVDVVEAVEEKVQEEESAEAEPEEDSDSSMGVEVPDQTEEAEEHKEPGEDSDASVGVEMTDQTEDSKEKQEPEDIQNEAPEALAETEEKSEQPEPEAEETPAEEGQENEESNEVDNPQDDIDK
jgi:large subunit ribosomal protein L17